MSWIFFSLLSTLILSIGNIADKYILTKWIRNPIVSVILFGITGLFASFIIYVTRGIPILSGTNIAFALIAGIINISSIYFYYLAIKMEEITRVTSLIYTTPLFVSILSAIFLGEIFDLIKYTGIILLIIGAIIISSKNFRFNFSRAFLFVAFYCFIGAVIDIITKYILSYTDFWTIFSYTRIGAIFALIPIIFFNFHEIRFTVKQHGIKVIGMTVLSEAFQLLGILSFIIALSTGYVTLSNALTSTEPFFTLLFVLLLSNFYPNVLKEEIDKSTIFLKFIAISLMFVGVLLIT